MLFALILTALLGVSTGSHAMADPSTMPVDITPLTLDLPQQSSAKEILALPTPAGPWQTLTRMAIPIDANSYGQIMHLRPQNRNPAYDILSIQLPYTERTNIKKPMSNILFLLMLKAHEATTFSQFTVLRDDAKQATLMLQWQDLQGRQHNAVVHSIQGKTQFFTVLLSLRSTQSLIADKKVLANFADRIQVRTRKTT